MEKTIAVLGGDRRMALLARLLAEDGHPVRTWGLAAFGMEDTALEEAAQADRVVLPVPLSRGKNLNCTAAALPLCGLFALLRPEQRLYAGGVKAAAPEVTVTYNFDSSGKLLTQIKEGADCDLFISAAPKQMNAMDGSLIGDAEKNPDGLDLIVTDSRVDLLENKVTLTVPAGNPKGIESFDQLAELLKGGDVMLAIGNSDVPVGQYTLMIFNYYGIDETAVADKLTYGNNVKEVTSQVSEAAADCGIIYATDAYSAGLTVVDSATAEMCGQVIYPAAVLKAAPNAETAKEFLAYLQTDKAMTVFEGVGFSAV